MRERDISLTDLMVEMLLHWRMFVVWMLIGGLLMGGLSYMLSVQTVAAQRAEKEQQQDAQTIIKQLEETLTLIQKNNVRAVLNYEDFSRYYNQSWLMQIDAANAPETELTFVVKAATTEQSYSIERLYEDSLVNGMNQWLADQNALKAGTNVGELVTLARRVADNLPSDSFTVRVVHITEEECRELADYVEEYIDYLQTKFTQNVGKHDIILVNRSFAWAVDTELLEQQRMMVNNITLDNVNANKLHSAFSPEEQTYYELLKAEKTIEGDESETGMAVSVLTPSVSIKYVFMGMVLFAFLYVLYLFLQYIFNNKLRATDDIRQLYNVPLLGSIPRTAGKRKVFAFVDTWIMKLRNRNKRIFSDEEATGLAAVAVKMAARKEGVTEVYCIGCDVKGHVLDIAEKFKKTLKEDNINLSILNNALYDQEALGRLSSARCVFLLEQAGATLYDEIARELELLQRQEIKVLGVVMVE